MALSVKDYKKIYNSTEYVINNMLKGSTTYNKRDQACFRAARNMALQSDFSKARLGCAIFYRGDIIGLGCNGTKSDPTQKKYNLAYRKYDNESIYSPSDHAIHAEIAAIKSIPRNKAKNINWSKVKVYLFRVGVGLNHCQGISKPCPACIHYLHDQGVRQVYYSDDYGFTKIEFSDSMFD